MVVVCMRAWDRVVVLLLVCVGRSLQSNKLSGWLPVELKNLTKLSKLYAAHLLPPLFLWGFFVNSVGLLAWNFGFAACRVGAVLG